MRRVARLARRQAEQAVHCRRGVVGGLRQAPRALQCRKRLAPDLPAMSSGRHMGIDAHGQQLAHLHDLAIDHGIDTEALRELAAITGNAAEATPRVF